MRKREPEFFNRELSWLEFNRRVMQEAMDPGVPLLERLKFLAITSSNLDEFFMVRVGGLQQLLEANKTNFDPAGLTTARQLAIISRRTREIVNEQYGCFLEELEVLLANAGINRRRVAELSPAQREALERLFDDEIYPVLAPIAVPSRKEFPLLRGLSLNLAVRIQSGRKQRFAIVTLPKQLPRFLNVTGHDYVLLEDLLEAFGDRLFAGEIVAEWTPFRITRNADLAAREDLAGDLLSQMREILQQRKLSACVRLEIANSASSATIGFLQGALQVRDDGVYRIPGPLDLSAYSNLARLPGFEALREQPWPPQPSPVIAPNESMFDAIARRDILLIHPYESFEPVIRLVEQAADDPDVLAIKQILYRTSENSPIVAALGRAANKGKHVTAIVELKARFDEARNIEWARALELAGVQVIYGLKWLKTHAKICIIVRRETTGVRRYVHFGTGNYNEITAALYTDVGLMTCNEDLGADATAFFNSLTGYSQPSSYRKLQAAPLGLRSSLLELIDSEIQRRKQGQKSLIMAKVNAVVDPEIIRALYRAAEAGVKIQLNVRGICCLRPGENIEVISIVDRFLEHARILYFHHGGEPRVFISSADWMPRNLDRRVELLVPVEDAALRTRLVAFLKTTFQDNVKARRLLPDSRYERMTAADPAVRTQQLFFEQARDAAKQAQRDSYQKFIPQRPADR